MADIKPALTAEEWADLPSVVLDNDHLAGPDIMMYLVLQEDGVLHLGNRDGEGVFEADILPATIPAVIALANAALPDGDPRKLTWDMVMNLQNLAMFYGPTKPGTLMQGMADAIASYLPPQHDEG